jgi:hypothetical protein
MPVAANTFDLICQDKEVIVMLNKDTTTAFFSSKMNLLFALISLDKSLSVPNIQSSVS